MGHKRLGRNGVFEPIYLYTDINKKLSSRNHMRNSYKIKNVAEGFIENYMKEIKKPAFRVLDLVR
jgi:hypothetical protein